jgi:hypothetical protein
VCCCWLAVTAAAAAPPHQDAVKLLAEGLQRAVLQTARCTAKYDATIDIDKCDNRRSNTCFAVRQKSHDAELGCMRAPANAVPSKHTDHSIASSELAVQAKRAGMQAHRALLLLLVLLLLAHVLQVHMHAANMLQVPDGGQCWHAAYGCISNCCCLAIYLTVQASLSAALLHGKMCTAIDAQCTPDAAVLGVAFAASIL